MPEIIRGLSFRKYSVGAGGLDNGGIGIVGFALSSLGPQKIPWPRSGFRVFFLVIAEVFAEWWVSLVFRNTLRVLDKVK